MNIEILQLIDGAKKARGLTVVIDVFRAFTVEAYAMAAGAESVLPVGSIDDAYAIKAAHPEYLLMGERGGKKCPGFDFGNSPSQLRSVDLKGKTLVHTTSAGTQGIANAVHADEILTGSLVNADAIARYIWKKNPEQVSLVCMGLEGREPTEEDTLCAEYIRARLLGENPDISAEMDDLRNTSGAKFFDPAQQEAFPQPDFDMCIQLNKFDFVLQVEKLSGEPRAWISKMCK
ncbi:MAG: 2-phosphosulfolactate phosphatase [Clostridiales bacterium]|nr:2-phosphosulfolactate phosphatase [Clostridiales bacterium]